jgi:hypothetical protein
MALTAYQATLLGIGTLLALATAYLTRKDRHEEVVENWRLAHERALVRVADTIVELTDAAEQVHLRRIARSKGPMAKAVMPADLRPSSVPVSRMKLRAALAGLPTQGLPFPKCRRLLTLPPDQIDGIPANEALDEIGDALTMLAHARAKSRARRGHSAFHRLRVGRAWRPARLGDPYE